LSDPATSDLVDALDGVREVRGSLPIFDGIVANDPARVRAALGAHPLHPLRDGVIAWLAARGVPPPETEGAEAALARHGITDLDTWVAGTRAREAALSRDLAESRAQGEQALRAANAYALVAALLAVLAIAGWLVAMGPLRLQEVPAEGARPARPGAATEAR
jgi:hypothetical protein